MPSRYPFYTLYQCCVCIVTSTDGLIEPLLDCTSEISLCVDANIDAAFSRRRTPPPTNALPTAFAVVIKAIRQFYWRLVQLHVTRTSMSCTVRLQHEWTVFLQSWWLRSRSIVGTQSETYQAPHHARDTATARLSDCEDNTARSRTDESPTQYTCRLQSYIIVSLERTIWE